MLYPIPLFPLIGFLINAALGRRLSKAVSGTLATAAMLASFGWSLGAVWRMLGAEPVGGVRAVEETLYTWISSGSLDVPLAFRLDPLSAVMILVVSGIGTLIHLYSTAYMHEETGGEYARYFSYLNLFAAFMLVLVLGANFPVMFIGWEGVGLCSYLLIGFWFTKPSAADAGKKAFIVNRIGDFGFILGMLGLFWLFGTLDFQEIAVGVAAMPVEVTFGVLTGLTLLLFLGATGKSRADPAVRLVAGRDGGPDTGLGADSRGDDGDGGCLHDRPECRALRPRGDHDAGGGRRRMPDGADGRRRSASCRTTSNACWPTRRCRQLGYMFLAMGVGAFAAGIFHLYTHAFFKALLFLGSGAVIHALHGQQDMRKMGGLKKDLPVTYWTFLIGTLAIAGFPFLSGFFSKDEILWKTYREGTPCCGCWPS